MGRNEWIRLLLRSVEEFNHYREKHPEEVPILRLADLRAANFRGVNLQRASLMKANLSGSNLCESNLELANLQGANLEGADLHGADLWATRGLARSTFEDWVRDLKESISFAEEPPKT